jgi:hypothetical protein
MRLRTHLLTSAALGLALYRRAPYRAALLTIAGVAIDLDHYLLYALRTGDWSPFGAARYNRWRHQRPRRGDTRPRYGSLRSVAHRPLLTLPLIWGLALRWSWARPVAFGLTLHLALDIPPLNLDWRIWRRSRGRCERCGVSGLRRDIHYIIPPERGGRRWEPANRAAWCGPCARQVRAASK